MAGHSKKGRVPRTLRLAVAVLVCLAGCARLHRVKPIEKGQASGEGAVYALPRTVLTVSAMAAKAEYSPDEALCTSAHFDHARALLGLTPGCAEECEPVVALSGWTVVAGSEPDDRQMFEVDLTSAGDSALSLEWDDRGVLQGSSSESTDRVAKAVVGSLQAAAQVAGAFSGTGGQVRATEEAGEGRRKDAGATGEPDAETPAAKEPDARVKEYCQGVVDKLAAVHGAIFELFKGAAGESHVETLHEKLVRLEALKREHQFQLTGRKVAPLGPVQCVVRPEAGVDSYELLPTPDTRATCLWPVGFEPSAAVAGGRITLAVMLEDVPSVSDAYGEEAVEATDRSFFYRVPRRAQVSVEERSGGATTLLFDAGVVPIAQLGVVRSLPRLGTSGKAKLVVKLDADTGALRSIETASEGTDIGGHALALAKAGAGLASDVKKSRQTESQRLQEQKVRLEVQAAIAAAEDKLAGKGGAAETPGGE